MVAKFMETFKEFPPPQKATSFTVEQAHSALQEATTTGH